MAIHTDKKWFRDFDGCFSSTVIIPYKGMTISIHMDNGNLDYERSRTIRADLRVFDKDNKDITHIIMDDPKVKHGTQHASGDTLAEAMKAIAFFSNE
jgi:hypothetical protein